MLRRFFGPALTASLSMTSLTSVAAPVMVHSIACLALFERPTDLGFGVNWTPHSHNVHIPEVLADPYVQFALKSDDFRLYLIAEAHAGRGVITDFKQIADATPLYSRGVRPTLIDGTRQNGPLRPEDLSHQDLVQYIVSHYRLADSKVTNKAFFTHEERQLEHPLIEALKRQGLVPALKPGQTTREPGLIEGAIVKLHQTWEDLLRSSPEEARDTLLAMPNKYVVAGGRFRESYFWDSYWIMKGLIESGYGETARGMLENFVSLYERYGIIPNGNRFYYLTRTQLPVFVEMIQLLDDHQLLHFSNPELTRAGAKSLEARLLFVAEDYYQSIWKNTDRYKAEFGLFGYSDGAGGAADDTKIVIRPEAGIKESRELERHSQRVFAESGWDMSYTRFGKRPQDWLPVDLNFMLMSYNLKLAKLFEKAGRADQARSTRKEAERVRVAIRKHLFDPETGLFLDYNFAQRHLSQVTTAASFFAFYSGIYAKTERSRKILAGLLLKLKPEGHFAIHTTDRQGDGQWDGSWSWAPLNEIAFQALLKYGLVKEARKLAFDYSLMVIRTSQKNGKTFFEKYRAEDGAINLPADTEIYGNEEGFGWTNGTLAVFLRALSDWGDLPALEKAIAAHL